MNRVLLIVLLLLFSITNEATAQRHGRSRYNTMPTWEVGLSTGASSFLTSVNKEAETGSTNINYWKRKINPGFGLAVKYNISPAIGAELSYLNTRLAGEWKDDLPPYANLGSLETPLNFDNNINQFDLLAVFNINQLVVPGEDYDAWHLFVKTGPGMTQIVDKIHFFEDKNNFNYKRFSYSIDAGFSFLVGDNLRLLAGSNFHIVNTDNLDGVHIFETNPNGEITRAYLHVSEIYNFTYVRVNYFFGASGVTPYRRRR